ncbi:MAG: metallophosphoesterase family protein [Syntrophus sp. (in: bacteria)]
MGKIYAIGDLHGCFSHLNSLLNKFTIGQNDTLLFLGDYIDRGPDSYEVVETILRLRNKLASVICLKGNHEQMYLDFLRGTDQDLFFSNGGNHTLRSYKKNGCEYPPPEHMRFFLSLKLYYETEDFIFVHAGLHPNVPLQNQNPKDMLWIRSQFYRSPNIWNKTIVFGHTHFSEPYIRDGKIGIDTGACTGGALTCVELPGMIFYHATI